MTKAVGFLGYDGVTLLDIAGPMQVFETANILRQKENQSPAYRIHLFAREAGDVKTDVGISLTASNLNSFSPSLLIIPGGPGVWSTDTVVYATSILQEASARSTEIAAVCLGAFLLGHAGLLDGRKAVTHWRYCTKLADMFPLADVDPDSIFVQDHVWTSAGVTAGIDLALALVERDFGHPLAVEVARRLVVYLKRSGGQSQYSSLLAAQGEARDGRLSDLHAWIADNLHRPLNTDILADRVGMSKRSFTRHYLKVTGKTPRIGVEQVRVDAAQRLLRDFPNLSIKRIAARCGFSDENQMRRAFIRSFGVGPLELRQRF
jgi:transcriptional regulator GlxA family with amidase domain